MAVWREDPQSHLIIPESRIQVARSLQEATGPIDYIFGMYPGSMQETVEYGLSQFQTEARERFPSAVFPATVISPGTTQMRGLGVTLTDHPANLSSNELAGVLDNLKEFGLLMGARKGTLAGQLPAILTVDHKMEIDPFFEAVDLGSLYVVMATLKLMLTKDLTFGVWGVGTLGRMVLRYLGQDLREKVIGFDPRVQRVRQSGTRVLANITDTDYLANVDVLVNTAPRGDDIRAVIRFLKKGIRIVVDTHPLMSEEAKEEAAMVVGAIILDAGVRKEGVRFDPPLPGRHPEAILGCGLQVLATLMGWQGGAYASFAAWVEGNGFEPFSEVE